MDATDGGGGGGWNDAMMIPPRTFLLYPCMTLTFLLLSLEDSTTKKDSVLSVSYRKAIQNDHSLRTYP
jgi:hypothetical protein